MKKIFALLILQLILAISFAQTNIPQLVNFSAVVRDTNNQPLVNTSVSVRLTFRQGGQNGSIVYCALHQNTTNANGFLSILLNRDILGVGCNGAPNTNFEDISWENGDFWMGVEYQTTPTTPFIDLGQLELASSFYAFAAGTAERLSSFDIDNPNDGDILVYNINTDKWEPMPIYSNNQQLSVSHLNDTLFLQNGGFVIIPNISVANDTCIIDIAGSYNTNATGFIEIPSINVDTSWSNLNPLIMPLDFNRLNYEYVVNIDLSNVFSLFVDPIEPEGVFNCITKEFIITNYSYTFLSLVPVVFNGTIDFSVHNEVSGNLIISAPSGSGLFVDGEIIFSGNKL